MNDKTLQSLVEAMATAGKQKTRPYDTEATVSRVEADGTAWVRIPGGEDDTPCKLTINAKKGDVVQVRVSGGRAFMVGNASSPPTDDTRANEAASQAVQAMNYSSVAKKAADSALEAAGTAATAAAEAVETADAVSGIAQQARTDAAAAQTAATAAGQAAQAAQNSLKSVVQGATTVEKAVSVMQTALEAVVDYDPQNDTTQEYFWHDAAGAHVLGTSGDYRNDIDSSGMKIVETATEESVAEFGANGARIGKEFVQGASDNESHLEMDYHSMQLIDKNDNAYFHVSDLRGSDGSVAMVDTFMGDGSKVSFFMNFQAVDRDYSVSVNDVEVTSGITKYYNCVIFDTAPAANDVIVVAYNTASSMAKAYTFGNRGSGSGIGALSVAEGAEVIASGNYSHAEGYHTTASGEQSHAEGRETTAGGSSSHAEGRETTASGSYSHAEGWSTTASGIQSHAEGYHTTASGRYGHAEGYHTTASGHHSHAEGYQDTTASGNVSHAEGTRTTASGSISHAEGFETVASGDQSHAQNYRTIAGYENQTAIGKYNDNKSTNAFEIGKGISDNNRSNAFAVDWNGGIHSPWMAGFIQMYAGLSAPNGWLMCDGSAVSRTDYAKLFSVIGTTYGTGDGSTTFNLPDLRGRTAIGAGTGTGLTARSLGDQTGAETVKLSDQEMAHGHGFTRPTVSSSGSVSAGITGGSHHHAVGWASVNRGTGSTGTRQVSTVSGTNTNNTSDTTHTHDLPNHSHTLTGGSVSDLHGASSTRTAHNNMQPSTVVNYIICTGL